jgi:hypothetical protein
MPLMGSTYLLLRPYRKSFSKYILSTGMDEFGSCVGGRTSTYNASTQTTPNALQFFKQHP